MTDFAILHGLECSFCKERYLFRDGLIVPATNERSFLRYVSEHPHIRSVVIVSTQRGQFVFHPVANGRFTEDLS